MTPPSATLLHKDKYRPDIDGLRALAVIFVVIHHAFPNILPGGFIGVDIFFVISGYLISKIIFTEVAAEQFSFLAFYERRIRRIFPALIAVLVFTTLLGWVTLFSDEFLTLGRHILAAAFFVENINLWRQAGYFDIGAELKPILHLWSLSVEEQFYIFWPIIVFLFGRTGRMMFTVLIVIFAVSFFVNLSTHRNKEAAAALKAHGWWFLHLPPYSSDLNPIEQAFSKLKAHLLRIGARSFTSVLDAIGAVCDLYEPAECRNYFKAAGYVSN